MLDCGAMEIVNRNRKAIAYIQEVERNNATHYGLKVIAATAITLAVIAVVSIGWNHKTKLNGNRFPSHYYCGCIEWEL